jgi:hypothetical protein
VTIIKSNKGKTKRNALILFLRSAFFKLCFSGIPSVVNSSEVEIKTSQLERRDKSRLSVKLFSLLNKP